MPITWSGIKKSGDWESEPHRAGRGGCVVFVRVLGGFVRHDDIEVPDNGCVGQWGYGSEGVGFAEGRLGELHVQEPVRGAGLLGARAVMDDREDRVGEVPVAEGNVVGSWRWGARSPGWILEGLWWTTVRVSCAAVKRGGGVPRVAGGDRAWRCWQSGGRRSTVCGSLGCGIVD
jgi:hypothetical protein